MHGDSTGATRVHGSSFAALDERPAAAEAEGGQEGENLRSLRHVDECVGENGGIRECRGVLF